MILEKPLWVLDPDKRWGSLERNGAFVLQQYKYGGVGKGVQLGNGILHLVRQQQSEGPLLSPAARVFHGSYRIITAFPVAMERGTGICPEEGTGGSEGVEVGVTSRGIRTRARIWLLSESNNRATASRDMITLLRLLASESIPAFFSFMEAESAGDCRRISTRSEDHFSEQGANNGQGEADLRGHNNSTSTSTSTSNSNSNSNSNIKSSNSHCQSKVSASLVGKASDHLVGILKQMSLSLKVKRTKSGGRASEGSAVEMECELWTDDVMGSLIFTLVPVRSLLICQGVCRSWNRLASQDSIWAERLESLNKKCDLLSSSDMAHVPPMPSFPLSSFALQSS
jgi:hypothetical protein